MKQELLLFLEETNKQVKNEGMDIAEFFNRLRGKFSDIDIINEILSIDPYSIQSYIRINDLYDCRIDLFMRKGELMKVNPICTSFLLVDFEVSCSEDKLHETLSAILKTLNQTIASEKTGCSLINLTETFSYYLPMTDMEKCYEKEEHDIIRYNLNHEFFFEIKATKSTIKPNEIRPCYTSLQLYSLQ